MTQADFYILKSAEPQQRLLYGCRLAEKAIGQGHRVYLHVSDESAAAEMDELLWSFSASSFLPHGPVGSADGEQLAIGWGEDPGEHHDVMINLSLAVPDFVGRFQRVLEIVVAHPPIRDALRASWQRYKHYGYPIKSREL